MVPVKYMLLIYSNPESWAGLSAEQREALGRDHAALTEELAEQGLLVSSAGLADPITSRTVMVRDKHPDHHRRPVRRGQGTSGGFLPGRVRRRRPGDRVRRRMPDAKYVAVEVRPVMDTSGLEM